jgi:hypothetical protein
VQRIFALRTDFSVSFIVFYIVSTSSMTDQAVLGRAYMKVRSPLSAKRAITTSVKGGAQAVHDKEALDVLGTA